MGLVATGASRAGADEVAAVFGLVGWLNVALAMFNLLPGAPLDGGRIVRVIAWRLTGDRRRASRIAAQCGRVLGVGLASLGLLLLFFSPGFFIDGLWLTLIGWFLAGAATAELEEAREEPRDGPRVGALGHEARA
jgi:Zn-dependent protease